MEVRDGVGNIIALSNETTATPTSTNNGGGNNGGGGGGGGGNSISTPLPSNTGVVTLIGVSYPHSTVFAYVNGNLTSSIKTNASGVFQITLNNIISGSIIGLNSQDANGRKSITVSYPVAFLGNQMTISNILVPTTIELSAIQLQRGDILRIYGQAPADAMVGVHIFSNEIINNVPADSDGSYELKFDTKLLAEDLHTTKSRSVLADSVSPFSQLLQFSVGKKGITLNKDSADVNKDGKVNIVDFSVLLYWWNSTNQKGLDATDLNHDKKINITDFSILLFQWNG
jgi:hypothetical protein